MLDPELHALAWNISNELAVMEMRVRRKVANSPDDGFLHLRGVLRVAAQSLWDIQTNLHLAMMVEKESEAEHARVEALGP